MTHLDTGDLGPDLSIDQKDITDNLLTVRAIDIFPLDTLNITNSTDIDQVIELKISTDFLENYKSVVTLGENVHVLLTGLKATPVRPPIGFKLEANSTLELSNGPDIGGIWDTEPGREISVDMGADSSSTLHMVDGFPDYPGSVFRGKDMRPIITNLSNGDQIIVDRATQVSYDDGVLNFKDADGKLVIEMPAEGLDEENLRFDGGTVSYACFLKGTHIATPSGEVCVETLKAGDKVLTASGGIATVKWLGYRTLYKNRIPEKDARRAFPILFKTGCIADNVPHRDLIVSPGHHLFFDGSLIPAMALVNDLSIIQLFDMTAFQYFHVELEQFEILLAEGVPAESYVDTGNRNMFQNAAEVPMNPDLRSAKRRPDVPGATVVRSGPLVEATRAKVLERSNRMWVPEVLKRVG